MRTWDLAKNPNGTVRVIFIVISGCLQRKMVTAETLWILDGPSLVKMGKGLAATTIGRDSGRPLIE